MHGEVVDHSSLYEFTILYLSIWADVLLDSVALHCIWESVEIRQLLFTVNR